MKRAFIILTTLFIMNLIFTGIMQSNITKVGRENNTLENAYSALHVQYSYLMSLKQELMRRERIVQYAEQNFDMILLKPDQLASGSIIKEIKEQASKKDEIKYSFIDNFNPIASSTDIIKLK